MEMKPTTRAALWGAAAGAIALGMIGSSFNIWVSRGDAERGAQQRATSAVANALAPFCVEKFRDQPNATANLVELRKLDEYAQVSYVEKGGWANVPGKSGPDSAVAKACAEMLVKPATDQPAAREDGAGSRR